MNKLTPWFNAKTHSPLREGWYDCKECKYRHYFQDGRWYQKKQRVQDGPALAHKMHWRGLANDFSVSVLDRSDYSESRSAEKLIGEVNDYFSRPMPERPTTAQIFEYAKRLCGSEQRAFKWLSRHCRALAGAPVELMDTPEGRELVLRVMYGIVHSVYQ